MKKQGMGGSAFFVGMGWLGLPAGAVCRPPAYLHEKEYYTAFLWVAIIKRKVCQRETLKNVASLCGVPSLNRCPPHNDHHNLQKSFAQDFMFYYNNPKERGTHK